MVALVITGDANVSGEQADGSSMGTVKKWRKKKMAKHKRRKRLRSDRHKNK
jgi:hypothetical protein